MGRELLCYSGVMTREFARMPWTNCLMALTSRLNDRDRCSAKTGLTYADMAA